MDLTKLTKKLEKLQSLVTLEKDVQIGDMKFTLRPLTTVEEIALHETANVKQSDGINYLITLKQETLGYAIYKIDDEVIPDVVESGERGKENMSKHVFIKTKIIQPMSQAGIDSLFNAYLVLNIELQTKVNENIKFSNADFIKKYLDQEAANAVEKTIDRVVEKAAAENDKG